MPSRAKSPRKSLPRLLCDFNSVGWSGDEEDTCYYSYDEKALGRMRPREGMRVFIYESGRDRLIMGCEATLERYQHPITNAPRWRLRPIPDTGFLGEL